MVTIRELQIVDADRIKSIAELHKQAFQGFFLTQMGIPFLHTLYTGYLEDVDSGIIVAEKNGKTVGFIAYSKDYPRFYKGLIRNHLLKFALCSLGAAVRHPSYISRLLGAFKKSDSVVKKERYVELASICVDPMIGNRGVGTKLINHLKSIIDFDTYAYINLETDTEGNDAVNRFYIANGFVLERCYTTAEDRRMNEYRFTPGEEHEDTVP